MRTNTEGLEDALWGGADFVAEVTSRWHLFGAVARLRRERRNGRGKSPHFLLRATSAGQRLLGESDIVGAVPMVAQVEQVRGPRPTKTRSDYQSWRRLAAVSRKFSEGPAVTFAVPTSVPIRAWSYLDPGKLPLRRLQVVVLDDGVGTYIPVPLRKRYQRAKARSQNQPDPSGGALERLKQLVAQQTVRRIPVDHQRLFHGDRAGAQPARRLWNDYQWAVETIGRDPGKAAKTWRGAIMYVSQPVSDYGISYRQEMALLDDIQAAVRRARQRLVVKLHPRQVPQPYLDAGFPVVGGNLTVEEIVVADPPAALVGLFSTALVSGPLLCPGLPSFALGSVLADRTGSDLVADFADLFKSRFSGITDCPPSLPAWEDTAALAPAGQQQSTSP